MKKNQPTCKSLYEAAPCQQKRFADEDIATRYFVYEQKVMDGSMKPTMGFIVVLDQGKDGYCRCKTVKIKAGEANGLSAETLTLFSGCLSVAQPMEPGIPALAKQFRAAAK